MTVHISRALSIRLGFARTRRELAGVLKGENQSKGPSVQQRGAHLWPLQCRNQGGKLVCSGASL